MLNRVLSPIQNELLCVQETLEKSFQIRSGHLDSFAHLYPGAVHSVLRPALVLLSAGMFGPLTSQVTALATVVQFIYLATLVHSEITEEDTPPADPRNGYQFPVLVGDYLYGRFFTTLCDAGIINYLRPLSEVICQINEGHILRLKNSSTGKNNAVLWLKIIQNETASLTSAACRLGGQLSCAPAEGKDNLKRFGLYLGTALGLPADWPEKEKFLTLAQQELSLLPPGEYRNSLQLLTEYIGDEKSLKPRLVV